MVGYSTNWIGYKHTTIKCTVCYKIAQHTNYTYNVLMNFPHYTKTFTLTNTLQSILG